MNNDFGYIRVAACSFPVALGNPIENAKRINEETEKAIKNNVQLIVFPELSLTGYTCGDLFLRKDLLDKVLDALKSIMEYRADCRIIKCVGAPLAVDNRLYNCAVYIQGRMILGVVPKTYIPNYNEFYEKRWFTSALFRTTDTIKLLGQLVPFTENLMLEDMNSDLKIGTEICEDLWVSSPPGEKLCKAGANLIINPSASTETAGKSEYRRDLVRMQSARCLCSYVYASSGEGESSTDVIFSGHCIIADNGKIIAEDRDSQVTGIVDIEKCNSDRIKFNSDAWADPGVFSGITKIAVDVPKMNILPEKVNAYPFVPDSQSGLKVRCNEILDLQTKGLVQRLRATGIKDVVLGLSGGLDSTLALIVCVRAFKYLQISTKHIHCISMPCFGTTSTTRSISEKLAGAFDTSFEEIDIKKACEQHLTDIGHEKDVYDIAYENVQARERTQILFDKSNMLNALVIGTGDMSELALGWCTYNGDHMSNYAVNAGVPKTLVKFIVNTYADIIGNDASKLLKEVCNLPISPELLPPDEDGNIAQKTEESIGKYDLHDFFLYHFIRNGFSRSKIFALAKIAFNGIVSEDEILATLEMFFARFKTQQFKRSCIPDGVKIGSVSLSPRGDWRMPSDLSVL